MMPTGWDWEWWFRSDTVRVTVTIDLCDVMVGVAWSGHDFVIKPLPCVVISIDTWDATPPARLEELERA